VKKIRNVVGILALGSALLAGCGGPQNSENNGNKSGAAPDAMKVALLTPGDINDAGWNQLANEGLQAVEKELGAQTAHQVTKKTDEHKGALADFGDQKYDLVLCHGFEYGERVKSVAPSYTNTKFVVVSGDVNQAPNVKSVAIKLDEAAYLIGMAAGGMTKSNVLGCIGGQQFPAVASAFQAFEKGAKSVNPKVTVKTIYLNSWEDQNKGKEAANSLLAQKADFLFHNADQAGKGMFDAAKEKNVMVFGSNRNQNDVAPNQCLASAIIDMPHAFLQIAKSVKDGTFKAEPLTLNIPNENIAVAWNPALKSKVPAPLMKKIEAAQAQIKAGKLKIGA
jgi:basic membrane protein A and related proteins